MTDSAKGISGTVISLGATITSTALESWLRIGSLGVGICAGCLTCAVMWRNLKRK